MVGCVAAINVNALCENGIPAEFERTSLGVLAAGRCRRVGEPGAGGDRAESGTHRAGQGASVPHSPLPHATQRTPGAKGRAWWIGAGFQRLCHPGKLNFWKPECFMALLPPGFQISRIPDFHPHHRHRGRHPCLWLPVRHSGRFLHGLVDQIRRTGRGLLQGGRGQVRVALGHLGIRVPQDLLHLVRVRPLFTSIEA